MTEQSWSTQVQRYLKEKVKFVEDKYREKSRKGAEKEKEPLVDINKFSLKQKKSVEIRESPKKKFMDLSPEYQDIAEYCKSLLSARFHGEVTPEGGGRLPWIACSLIGTCVSLSDALKGMDEVLRSADADFSGLEEEFVYYLRVSEYLRGCHKTEEEEETFLQQSRRFVKVYKRRGGPSEELTHDDYWASRQQLLAGKVIADFVDPACGPMDPIFGILLNPTAGRTGPGDSGFVHDLLFDNDGPMAYHSAVHDGFGYLKINHNVGPGYSYLGAWSFFGSDKPLAGQLSGINFWKNVLKDTEDLKLEEFWY